MATREQRKESRRLAKRVAKRQERHRRAAAVRAGVAPADIRRNVHVEKGRAVTLDDIRPYARQKCGKCRKHPGLMNLVKNDDGSIRGAEPCKCAHERFMKAHPEVIVEASGAAWWPAEQDGPFYQTVDTAGVRVNQSATRPPEPGETDEPPPQLAKGLIGGDHTTPVDGCLCVHCRAAAAG